MKNLIFITGNQHKADYLAKWLDMPIAHRKLDLDEIQSLDLRQVAEHKARQAYAIVGQPVLVEDVSVTLHELGKLPGPFIKWFLEELGVDGLCKFAASLPSQDATVAIAYALCDGELVHFFESEVRGTVPPSPRGENGFGWNAGFVPEGSPKTFAEMTDDEVRPFNPRYQAIQKLHAHLLSSLA